MYRSFQELGDDEEQHAPQQSYSLIEIQDAEHKELIRRKNLIVCVDIYADWCQPCKDIEPRYADIASRFELRDTCAVVKENLDKRITPDITGVPTFQFFRNGNLVDQIVGADIEKVEKTLTNLLGMGANTQQNSQRFSQSQGSGPAPMRHTIRNHNATYQGQTIDTGDNQLAQSVRYNQSPYQSFTQESFPPSNERGNLNPRRY